MTHTTRIWSADAEFPSGDQPYPLAIRGRYERSDWPGWTFQIATAQDGRLLEFGAICERGISVRELRAVPVGAIHQAVRELVSERLESWQDIPEVAEIGYSRERLTKAAKDFLATPRPGKAGRADVDYLPFVTRYVELCRPGGSATPVKDLAQEVSASASQVANMLHEARKRGLLTEPPQKGKPGGVLTEKARKLLENTGD